MKEHKLHIQERAMFDLRDLFRSRGFLTFKMSKFEEYDLYAGAKDFLVSGGIITFTDRSGRLLALKPDVTLSIVKNYRHERGVVDKVCYAERVYRPTGANDDYKEIPQVGLECIGDISSVDTVEVIAMAQKSLLMLGKESVLQLSHMGILSSLLEECGASEPTKAALTEAVGQKSAHAIKTICENSGICPEMGEKLTDLIKLHGKPEAVLPVLASLSHSETFLSAYDELCTVTDALSGAGMSEGVVLDFSIVQDRRYYNGIVFRGYLSGIPTRVLSGGRYDPLLLRMGKEGGAVGFAVYLDLLEGAEEALDADVLLLYDESDPPAAVMAKAKELGVDGCRVMTQRNIPEKLRFGRIVTMKGEEKA